MYDNPEKQLGWKVWWASYKTHTGGRNRPISKRTARTEFEQWWEVNEISI